MVDDKVVPLVGIAGAGSGMTLGVFVGEVVTRITGQTGWAKFGIKAIVKGLLTGALYLISARFSGLLSFGVEVASYGVAGSLIPDLFEVALPGGILGLAEGTAVAVRSAGLKKPTQERREESRFEKPLTVDLSTRKETWA